MLRTGQKSSAMQVNMSVLLNKDIWLHCHCIKTQGIQVDFILAFVHHCCFLKDTAAISPGLTRLPFVPGYFYLQKKTGLRHSLYLQESKHLYGASCMHRIRGVPQWLLTSQFLFDIFLLKQCVSPCLTDIGKQTSAFLVIIQGLSLKNKLN